MTGVHLGMGNEQRASERLNDNHAHDARAVANLLLDVADGQGIPVSNLSLQKLLYFAHGLFLIARGSPLVSGYFEAWEYGPVHPQVYGAFKAAGNQPIRFRATRRIFPAGTTKPIEPVRDQHVETIAAGLIETLGRLPPRRLVDLSHATGGPWAHIVNEARTGAGLGLRISDSIIRERFGRHKLTLDPAWNEGDDPGEDTPLAC